MEEKHLSLDPQDQPRIMKVFQLIFGVMCIIVAFYYFISGIDSDLSGITLWITIIFLLLFGIYQIMAGTGKTKKYFSISGDLISYKQHSFLPGTRIQSAEIEKIILHPLSIIFHLWKGKKYRFRFGISYPEIIDPVKQNVIDFAESFKIPFEVVEDEM